MKRNKKNNEQVTYEFSKRVVLCLLIIAVINAEIPYVLSFLGKESVVDLGREWIITVIAVTLGYFCKAFFGKREQERVRLKERQMDFDEQDVEQSVDSPEDVSSDNIDNINNSNDEEAVG